MIHIAIATAFLMLAAVPAVPAAHCCGPCTHEWVETALAVPGDHRQGGFRLALANAGERAGGCIDNGIGWEICELIDCPGIILP